MAHIITNLEKQLRIYVWIFALYFSVFNISGNTQVIHWQPDIRWQWADLRWLEHRKYIHSKCLHLYIIRRVSKWENVCLYLFWCAMHITIRFYDLVLISGSIMTSLWRLDIVNISAPAPPVCTSHISNTAFIFNEQFISSPWHFSYIYKVYLVRFINF